MPTTASSMPNPALGSREHQLEIKRVETLYQQTYPAIAANLLSALLFALVLGWHGYAATALIVSTITAPSCQAPACHRMIR